MKTAKLGHQALSIATVLTMVFSLCASFAPRAQASSAAVWSSVNDFNFNASTAGTPTTKSSAVVAPSGVTLGLQFVSVAAGNDMSGNGASLGLRSDGTLWAWGSNSVGQLGQGTVGGTTSAPVQIGSGTTWESIAGGGSSFFAIKNDGTLWAWGDNSSGQLGQGNNTQLHAPTQVGSATNWQSVSAGWTDAIAVRSDGTLWAWGDNSLGQLGQGNTTALKVPTRVGTAANWQAASISGDQFSGGAALAIKKDGTLWAWGDNTNGALGLGDTVQRTTPVQVGSATNWQSIAVGDIFGTSFSLALKTDGTLWTWGSSAEGALGQGTGSDLTTPTQLGSATWQSIFVGTGSSFAVKSDGTLWAWGDNDGGQLGQGEASASLTPLQVGTDNHWLAVAESGFENGFAVGAKTDGTLWVWGDNTTGQLGLGFTGVQATTYSPAQVGSATNWSSVKGVVSSLGIKTDHTLWDWGYNANGELGQGDLLTRTAPTQVGALTTWQSIAGGNDHTVAVKTDGTLWSWGANGMGQLGQGNTTELHVPTQVGVDTHWATVAAGQYFTVAVKTDGTLWSWGGNPYGELGNGSSDANAHPTPTQVGVDTHWATVAASVDGETVLATKTDGTLWSWGLNTNGQLGNGSNDTNPHSTPTQVGSATTWASVSVSYNHSLAVRTDHTLWSWGYNGFGQLGQGNTSDLHVPTQVGALTTWASVATGVYFSLATKTDGTLWSWGLNNSGQLGQGNTSDLHVPTQVGALTTWASVSANVGSGFAIKTDHTLWDWGTNSHGELGYPVPLELPNLVVTGTVPGSGNLSGLTVNTGVGTVPVWNTLSWTSVAIPVNASIQVEYRTSADGITYSSYSSPVNETTLGATSQSTSLLSLSHVPYLQLEVILNSTDGVHLPTLTGLNVTYDFAGNTVAPPPTIASFIATPATVSLGQSTTLTWNATGAISVSVSPGIGPQPGGPTGSAKVTPASTTTYTLTIANSSGQASAQVTVGVGGTYLLSPPAVVIAPVPTATPMAMPTPTPASVAVPAGAGAQGSSVVGVLGAHPDGALVVSKTGTIYLIRSGQLWGFRSPGEYKTWGFTFSQALPENSVDASLPLGGLLKAADGSLVLDSSDSRTVYVVNAGHKMGFTSSKVFAGLGYGKTKLVSLNLSDYPAGNPVSSASAPHPVGSLVASGGAIYQVIASAVGTGGNQLAAFPSMAVFSSYGYSTSQVVLANVADLALPRATPVLLRDGTLVSSSGSYYVISDGQVRPFSSPASMGAAGYSSKGAVAAGIGSYKVGPQAF